MKYVWKDKLLLFFFNKTKINLLEMLFEIKEFKRCWIVRMKTF